MGNTENPDKKKVLISYLKVVKNQSKIFLSEYVFNKIGNILI